LNNACKDTGCHRYKGNYEIMLPIECIFLKKYTNGVCIVNIRGISNGWHLIVTETEYNRVANILNNYIDPHETLISSVKELKETVEDIKDFNDFNHLIEDLEI